MRRVLAASGLVLLVLALAPYRSTQDFSGIKRVREFGLGLDLYRLRIVESGHAGRDDWTELERRADIEPLGVSSVLLFLGAGALVGSMFLPRRSRAAAPGAEPLGTGDIDERASRM